MTKKNTSCSTNRYELERKSRLARLAGMTKKETSGGTDSAETERKVRKAEMMSKEYSSSANKTKPERNTFVLSHDKKLLYYEATI